MSSSRSGSATTAEAATSSARDPLAVAGVRIQRPGRRVLHLDLREVLRRVSVDGHPPPRVQPEVRRVRRPEDPEPQPVRIVGPVPARGPEEPLRRRVRAHHEHHVRETREDLRPRGADGLRPRRARRVHARRPGPPASPAPWRTSPPPHSPDSRHGRCPRRRSSRRPASRPPRRRAPRARPPSRTRRSRAPTCPRGACPRRAPPRRPSCRHPRRPPVPGRPGRLRVLVQHAGDDLHLHAHRQIGDGDPGNGLPEHHQPFGCQFHSDQRVRLAMRVPDRTRTVTAAGTGCRCRTRRGRAATAAPPPDRRPGSPGCGRRRPRGGRTPRRRPSSACRGAGSRPPRR